MSHRENEIKESATSLNLVILPDDQTTGYAIGLSQQIARDVGTEFILDPDHYKPHLTLYQGYYPDRNLPRLKDAIDELAREVGPLEISLSGGQIVTDTFIFWNAGRTSELLDLHEASFARANPLREGMIPPSALQIMPSLDASQRERLWRTGGILNGREFFHPHVTITRVKDAVDAERAREVVDAAPPYRFGVDRLYLAHLGPNGTVSDIVEEFKLK